MKSAYNRTINGPKGNERVSLLRNRHGEAHCEKDAPNEDNCATESEAKEHQLNRSGERVRRGDVRLAIANGTVIEVTNNEFQGKDHVNSDACCAIELFWSACSCGAMWESGVYPSGNRYRPT